MTIIPTPPSASGVSSLNFHRTFCDPEVTLIGGGVIFCRIGTISNTRFMDRTFPQVGKVSHKFNMSKVFVEWQNGVLKCSNSIDQNESQNTKMHI